VICIFSICLVSNLVGLDEQVTVDGNDDLVKSPILLSQSATKSTSTKGKKLQQSIVAPPSSNKRPLEAHRTSVSNVSDLRLQKRGKVQEERTVDRNIPKLLDSEEAAHPTTSTKKNLVTPSPHPHAKHQDSETVTPRRNDTSSSGKRDVTTNQSQALPLTGQRAVNNPSLASTRMKRGGQNNSRSSWFQEKSHQKTAQQTAFSEYYSISTHRKFYLSPFSFLIDVLHSACLLSKLAHDRFSKRESICLIQLRS